MVGASLCPESLRQPGFAPLASMKSATRGADHIARCARSAKEGLSRFDFVPVDHSLLVHLTSAGSCTCQPVRISLRPHALTAPVVASVFRYVPPSLESPDDPRHLIGGCNGDDLVRLSCHNFGHPF